MSKKWRIRLYWRTVNTIGAIYRHRFVEANSQKEAADKVGVSLHYFKENAIRIESEMKENHKCQMTIESDFISGRYDYLKCDRPAKFINPKPKMGVQYVCGIHARSLDKMYERTKQSVRCVPLSNT